jgi:hypothetical protein
VITQRLHLGENLLAALVEAMPGHPLVRRWIDEKDDVVTVFQIAAQDRGPGELDLETVRITGPDTVADVAEVSEENALPCADETEVVGSQILRGDELHGLAFLIEEDGPYGALGRREQVVKDPAKWHAMPRL